MPKRVAFTGKQQLTVESFDVPVPGEGQVQLKTEFTLMSTGTENIVFNRLFDPGTHWDRWVRYPFHPGYCAVGVIEKVGPGVTKLRAGQRVFGRFGHASHHVVQVEHAHLLPDGVDPREMTWMGLIKIAGIGARAADYKLGDSVAVVGAGPIGQMTVRWAAASGAGAIAIIDPVASRLELAKRGGATAGIAKPVGECLDDLKAACNGDQPRVVFDTTGHPSVFAQALALPRRFGRVVLLGDTGTPAQQHLTADVVTRGLSIVGAHDTHNDDTWNEPIVYRHFLRLHVAGRFNLAGLITHTFRGDHAEEAYRVANTRRGETMGILFDWTAV